MNDKSKVTKTTDKGGNPVIIKIGPTQTPNLDQYIDEMNRDGRDIRKAGNPKGAPAS